MSGRETAKKNVGFRGVWGRGTKIYAFRRKKLFLLVDNLKRSDNKITGKLRGAGGEPPSFSGWGGVVVTENLFCTLLAPIGLKTLVFGLRRGRGCRVGFKIDCFASPFYKISVLAGSVSN